MAFDANAKQLNYTGKLKTASGKCRINMVTWSFLPFAVNVSLNLCNVQSEENRMLEASCLTKTSSGQN